jgi:diacylglycerol kinase
MKTSNFSISQRIRSFAPAFNGFRIAWKQEHNFRIHLFALPIVLLIGVFFEIETMEWVLLFFASGLVLVSELLNTAIEILANFVCKEQHPEIGKLKDVAAAAVLVSVFTAVIVALIIFLPRTFF